MPKWENSPLRGQEALRNAEWTTGRIAMAAGISRRQVIYDLHENAAMASGILEGPTTHAANGRGDNYTVLSSAVYSYIVHDRGLGAEAAKIGMQAVVGYVLSGTVRPERAAGRPGPKVRVRRETFGPGLSSREIAAFILEPDPEDGIGG